MSEKNRGDIDAQLKRIGDLLAERKKDDYNLLFSRLVQARELFHDLIAERLVQPMNAHLASLPATDVEQKQELARVVNSDLRALGLAIRCPKTGEPAHLRGASDTPSGRFQICLTADANYGRTLTAKTLPHLDLMSRSGRPGSEQSVDLSWKDRMRSKTKGHRGDTGRH